jgi:DNA-directed RNA polymerase specialized sigma24 family protein
VIDADTSLVTALQSGNVEALMELVERYGGPVTGLAMQLTGDDSLGHRLAPEVFAAAWGSRDHLEPGSEFAPWLASTTVKIAAESLTSSGAPGANLTDADVERAWSVASATSSLPADRHKLVRSFYVDGIVVDERESDVARDRIKIERRLGHLDAALVANALADPRSWVTPDPALADRVRESVASRPPSSRAMDAADHDERVVSPEPVGDLGAPASAASPRRSVRSAMVGFGGAFVVLFGGIALLSAFSGSPKQADFTVELIPTGVVAEVEGGTITVTERETGIEIRLDAPTLPSRSVGAFYEGLVLLDTGEAVTVGTFAAGADVTLWGGVPLDRVRALNVVLGEVGATPVSADSPASVVLKADFPRP